MILPALPPVSVLVRWLGNRREEVYVSPAHGFGELPAGTYSMRVYFPFLEQKYYSSNLVRFEMPKRKEKKEAVGD